MDSRIQDCLGFPYSGVINVIKKKRWTIAIKEHKIWKPNKKGNICERNWAECSGKAKTIMWKCIFACVNKNLLLVHPRNCPLVPVDDFPVSCGSYVYLLVISQSLDSILWYILFTFYYLVFALYFLVFALCLIKLHCSQPILRFKNLFFMSIIMMKNRLHSNNSLSSNSFIFSLVLPEKKIHMHTDIQYITKMLFKD